MIEEPALLHVDRLNRVTRYCLGVPVFVVDDQKETEYHGQQQRGCVCIKTNSRAFRAALQDMTDTRLRWRTRPCQNRMSREQERESLEGEQQIFHRRKRNNQARGVVDQVSVRYSQKATTQVGTGEIGMGHQRNKNKKEKIIISDAHRRGLGFVVELAPIRRGVEWAKAG